MYMYMYMYAHYISGWWGYTEQMSEILHCWFSCSQEQYKNMAELKMNHKLWPIYMYIQCRCALIRIRYPARECEEWAQYLACEDFPLHAFFFWTLVFSLTLLVSMVDWLLSFISQSSLSTMHTRFCTRHMYTTALSFLSSITKKRLSSPAQLCPPCTYSIHVLV